jgi:hypothetical protein
MADHKYQYSKYGNDHPVACCCTCTSSTCNELSGVLLYFVSFHRLGKNSMLICPGEKN